MKVGFIGLGLMGSRMASNLLAKEFEVIAYNRTRARAEALAPKGAVVADTPREVAEKAHVICTCVADPKAMEAVFFGPNGIRAGLQKGTAMVDFSTISPELTRKLEAECIERGAGFLEAPVTGSKLGAEHGTLVLMCGGPRTVFDEVEPVLSAVGKKAIHVGDVGAAAQVKLIGNMLIAHMLEGLHEGAALAAKSGIPLSKVLEVVQSSGYSSPYWDFKARALESRDFSTHFAIDLMHKDLTLALQTGLDLGVPMPGTAAIREVYSLARVQGYGDKDISATAIVVNPDLAKE